MSRIARAGEAAAQLVAPIAGEHQMRVGIDEAGHDGATRRVDDLRVRRERDRAADFVGGADEDDRASNPATDARSVSAEIVTLREPAPRRRPARRCDADRRSRSGSQRSCTSSD